MALKVLFVCIENSCRSQIAEGFARKFGQGVFEPASAGSRPSGKVNPKAIDAMAERGIDISGQQSKGLNEFENVQWDYVVTMGCGDACPFVRAKHRLDWQIPDPKAMPKAEFNKVCGMIETNVRALIDETSRPKFLAEVIGTFCLVFAGTGAVVVDQVTGGRVTGLGISLVFGLIVLAMIYTIGHVSGAHMNPAVTLGFYSAGRHKREEILPYLAAQLLGAVAASVTLKLLFANQATNLGLTLPAGSDAQSFLLELIMSFMLMFTIMGVATDDRAEGAMAGIAIGGVIALEAAFGGPISGASMNPARSFAPALLMLDFSHHWLYWVAPILGTMVGARAYKLLEV